MPASDRLLPFCAASLALLVIPGPSVLYIVARSIDGGRRIGILSMLGVEVGSLGHVTAAALGVSALVVSSSAAFSVVRIAGAAYLVVLGLRRLFGSDHASTRLGSGVGPAFSQTRGDRARRHFRRGILVQLLNPKVALFFLAFLPQFVDADRGAVALQVTVLGLVFVVLAIVSDGTYALLAASAGERLRRSARFARVSRYGSGGVFVGLGLLTLVGAERPHT